MLYVQYSLFIMISVSRALLMRITSVGYLLRNLISVSYGS